MQYTESILRVYGGVAVLTCGGLCGEVQRTTPGASWVFHHMTRQWHTPLLAALKVTGGG